MTIFKQSLKSLIILLLFLIQVQNACYSYYAGDTYPSINNSYCANIIKWPVSDETFENYEDRDDIAKQNYKQLYEQYYQSNLVTTDCLGMAKYFFCANAYPTCSSDQTQINSMCTWMCDLFSVRCGTSNKFYQQICVQSTVTGDTCSFDGNITIVTFAFMLVVLALLL